MNRSNLGASTNFIQIILDILVGSSVFFLSTFFVNNFFYNREMIRCVVIFVVFMFIYILINKDSQIYNITSFFYFDRVAKYITKSFFLATMVVTALIYYVDDSHKNRLVFSKFILLAYISFLLEALIFRAVSKKKNKDAHPRTVYIGDVSLYKKFEYYLKKTNVGINFLGYIKVSKVERKRNNNELFLGNIEDLEFIIRENSVDQVYFFVNSNDKNDMQEYVDLCVEMGVTVRMVMDTHMDNSVKSYVSCIGTYPVVTFHTISLNNAEKFFKRLIDIIGAVIGIIIFMPIMLISAIAIKLTSKGPVIFKQKRVGMNGRVFVMYKFRTMCNDAEKMKNDLMKENEINDNCLFKIKNDPRVNTRVGRFLRRTSIDEIPQFFNVLLGNMSLVGTRPPTLDEVENYKRSYWRRISIKPGITGMWQVNGRSTVKDFEQVLDLDTRYIDEWNVWLDLELIFKTICVIFRKDNAY